MKHESLTRILALDLHPRSFGYVVIERPTKLLDWGVCRSYRKTKRHPEVLVGGRLRPLLEMWMPDVVVTRIGERSGKAVRAIFGQIKKEVGRTPFRRITDSRDRYLGRRKYERAVEIAARFPEIGWKLPPKRKAWESEHYRMSMFSAAALAMTYRSLRYGTVTSPPGGVMPKFTQSSKS